MLKIDPDTLYPLDELEELLKGHVELPTFMDRLGLKKDRVFRDAVWGWEILEASRRARPFSSLSQSQGRLPQLGSSPGGSSAARAQGPTRRLTSRDLQP